MRSIRLTFAFALCALSLGYGVTIAAPAIHDMSKAIGLRPSYSKCGDASGGVTVVLLDCDQAEYAYQNKRLNKTYKSLLDKLSKSEQVRLRDEEQKWIAYRDHYCAPDPDSGTAAEVGSSGCIVAETAKQANALEARPGSPAALVQYEGDKNGLRSSYIKCIEATHGVGPESHSCMGVEYKFQDARLNNVYQALMVKLSKSDQEKLRSDEKTWIAFRDTHCAPSVNDDESKSSAINDCLVEETAKQAFAIEARLSFM